MVRTSNLLLGSYSHFLNSFFAFILSSLSSVLCMSAFAFFSAQKSIGLPTLPILSFPAGSPPFRGLCRPSSKACLDHTTENPQRVIRVPGPFGCVESSTAHAPPHPILAGDMPRTLEDLLRGHLPRQESSWFLLSWLGCSLPGAGQKLPNSSPTVCPLVE